MVTNAKRKPYVCNPEAFCVADNSPLTPNTVKSTYLAIDIITTNRIIDTSTDLQA